MDAASIGVEVKAEGLCVVRFRFQLYCDLLEAVADAVDADPPMSRQLDQVVLVQTGSESLDAVVATASGYRLITESFADPGNLHDPENAATVREALDPQIQQMWSEG